jgi:hypothetical protein
MPARTSPSAAVVVVVVIVLVMFLTALSGHTALIGAPCKSEVSQLRIVRAICSDMYMGEE